MTFQKPTGREVRVASETWPIEAVELRAEGDGMTFERPPFSEPEQKALDKMGKGKAQKKGKQKAATGQAPSDTN